MNKKNQTAMTLNRKKNEDIIEYVICGSPVKYPEKGCTLSLKRKGDLIKRHYHLKPWQVKGFVDALSDYIPKEVSHE